MHVREEKIKSELSLKPFSTDVVKSFKDRLRFFARPCVEKKLDLDVANPKIKLSKKCLLCSLNPEI